MTATSQRRDEQIAAFYRDHVERLTRAVRRRVDRVGDEVIEDACQITWATLLRRPDIPLDARGLSWLSTVAVHEAWRLGSITREQPAGTLTTPAEQNAEQRTARAPRHRSPRHRRARTRPHRAPCPPAGHPRAEAARARGALTQGSRLQLSRDHVPHRASYTAVNRRITEGRAALREQLGDDGPRRR